MFCQNCGKDNKQEALFCESCGSKLRKEEQVVENKETINKVSNNSKDDYYSGSNNSKVAKVRNPLSLKMKVIIIASIIIIALVSTLFIVGNSLSSPEKVAKKYMQGQVDKEWGNVYDSLAINESEFLSKDLYIDSKSGDSDKQDITSFNLDNKNDYSKKDSQVNLSVNYKLKNQSNFNKMLLTLDKQEDKFLFFFDKWKVSSVNEIQKDYSIDIPSGTTGYFDGVELTDKYKGEHNYNSGFSNGYDTYTIPEVFNGTHKVKLTSAIFNDYEQDVEDKYNARVSSSDLELKEEAKTEVENISKDIINKFYEAALSGKKYDEIKDYFSPDEDVQDDMKRMYEDFTDNVMNGTDKKEGINKVTITNIKTEATEGKSSGSLVNVKVKFDYEYTGKKVRFFSDEIVDNNSDGVKTADQDIDFDYVDGKWVITYMRAIYVSTY